MSTFAERFTKALDFKGMSGYKLSQVTGMHQTNFSLYKSGKTIPRRIVMDKLAQVLGVEPQWLATGEGVMADTGGIEPGVAERLKTAMKFVNITINQLAIKLRVHNVSVINDVLQNNQNPDVTILNNFTHEFPSISNKWLRLGVGEMVSHEAAKDITVSSPYEIEYLENSNSNSFIKLENGQYLMTMPLAEFNIQAGLLDYYQDAEFLNGLSKHSIIVDKPVKGRYVAFRVKGDSMDNGKVESIQQNFIVSTRELQRHHWTSPIRFKVFPYWVIYTTQSRYPLLKQIIGHDVEHGTILCHSLNDAPEYTDFELPLDEVQALFYVVDINRPVSRYDTYEQLK